jgi:hypothetical protein
MKAIPAYLLICLSFLFMQTENASGQDKGRLKNPISIGIRGHYGFIIPHSKTIADLANTNPWGMEGEVAWLLMREKTWKHCYCYPRAGFSLSYFNFKQPEVLGHSIILYPFIEPYIRPHRRFSISFRFGIGPALLTKVYDADSNPDNLFFSNHLSFIAMLNAGLNYRLSKRLTGRAAFNYNHISNGGITQPNLGMNFPSVNLGFDYSLSEVCFPSRAKDSMQVLYSGNSWWEVYVLGSRKNVNNGEEQYYAVLGAGAYYNYLILRVLALNAGTELISDLAEKERIRREYIQDPASAPRHLRAAVLLGIDLVFGRVTFVHQWGLYYYAPYPAMKPVYQRYGLNLGLSEHLYLGVNIKAHGHVADLMDVRLGLRF